MDGSADDAVDSQDTNLSLLAQILSHGLSSDETGAMISAIALLIDDAFIDDDPRQCLQNLCVVLRQYPAYLCKLQNEVLYLHAEGSLKGVISGLLTDVALVLCLILISRNVVSPHSPRINGSICTAIINLSSVARSNSCEFDIAGVPMAPRQSVQPATFASVASNLVAVLGCASGVLGDLLQHTVALGRALPSDVPLCKGCWWDGARLALTHGTDSAGVQNLRWRTPTISCLDVVAKQCKACKLNRDLMLVQVAQSCSSYVECVDVTAGADVASVRAFQLRHKLQMHGIPEDSEFAAAISADPMYFDAFSRFACACVLSNQLGVESMDCKASLALATYGSALGKGIRHIPYLLQSIIGQAPDLMKKDRAAFDGMLHAMVIACLSASTHSHFIDDRLRLSLTENLTKLMLSLLKKGISKYLLRSLLQLLLMLSNSIDSDTVADDIMLVLQDAGIDDAEILNLASFIPKQMIISPDLAAEYADLVLRRSPLQSLHQHRLRALRMLDAAATPREMTSMEAIVRDVGSVAPEAAILSETMGYLYALSFNNALSSRSRKATDATPNILQTGHLDDGFHDNVDVWMVRTLKLLEMATVGQHNALRSWLRAFSRITNDRTHKTTRVTKKMRFSRAVTSVQNSVVAKWQKEDRDRDEYLDLEDFIEE